MALRQGALVWYKLKIADDTMLVALADHEDIQGGYHVIDTLADRNGLPSYIREAGMIVRVWNDPDTVNNGEYQLIPGTTSGSLTDNGNWVQVAPPNAVTNKLYVPFTSADAAKAINWGAIQTTFGNAPVAVAAYQLQGDGSYSPMIVQWNIDAYPATTLTVYTNNETGFLIIM